MNTVGMSMIPQGIDGSVHTADGRHTVVARYHPKTNCEDCPYQKYNNYVPSEINGNKLHIVGEAPGAAESKIGRPFVGQSGKLLERTLNSHSISREDCTLTNVVACKPRGNKEPDPKAIECCQPRLESELHEAHTILACGNTAASAVLGRKTKITQERVGPGKVSPRYPGSRIILTIHPAACLRIPDHYPNFDTDIGKVNTSSKTEWIKPEIRIFGDCEDTVIGAKIALTQLLQRVELDPLAIDLEVGEEKDEHFGHPEKLLSVGISYSESSAIVIGECALREPKVRELFAKIVLTRKGIWHNAAYDLGVLYRLGIVSARAYWCTMLASYVLDERRGIHGLKYLAKELLGAPDWDAELKQAGGFNDAPRHVLYKYNAYDAVATYRLYKLQLESPEWDEHADKLFPFLLKAQHVLNHVAMEGIKVDIDALEDLAKTLSQDIYDLTKAFQKDPEWLDQFNFDTLEAAKKFKDKYFNPNSPQQVKNKLAEMGVRVGSTDEEHLMTLINKCEGKEKYLPVVQFARDILAYRKIGKLYGTYVKGVQKRLYKGRIHTTYLLHGTTTGRTSSRNINIQNIPRGDKIRKIYVPEEGNSFIQVDLKNAEGRVVFHLSNSITGRKILQQGRDIHGEVAKQAFGPDYTYEERVHAKSVVHGVNYGRTPHGIASDPDLNVSLSRAMELFNAYKALVPEVFDWQKEMERIIFSSEPLITPFGRKRRFALVTRENREDVYKEGLAFKPQSISSDIALNGAIALWGSGFNIRNFVHDSVLFEAPDDEAEDQAKEASSIMEKVAADVYTTWIDFPVDYEIGKSWGVME